jgi:hypothetical protein
VRGSECEFDAGEPRISLPRYRSAVERDAKKDADKRRRMAEDRQR